MPETEIDAPALLAAWTKLARSAPSAALERYRPLVRARRLASDERSRYALELALGLSWDRQAVAALDLFHEVEPSDLDDYALAWQARAALWAGDWREVERSISAMSDAQRGQARWRYWAGRVAEQRRHPQEADAFYASVLGDDNYYAAMAAAHLQRPALPHLEILAQDSPLLNEVALFPAFVRARELFRAGLLERAVAEWQYGLGLLDASERRQAILLAALWGWHDVAVATATQEGVFNDYELLYPRPYAALVEAGAKQNALETPLLFGLIRQESLFRIDAGSAAGALGLMQLLPETARRVARDTGHAIPQRADLFDPQVNIRLGAAHLRSLIDGFDGNLAVALAGYNAGANAAERWLPPTPLDADIWIENIPYNETREYVQRVLWHSVVFAWLASGEGKDTGSWIARVDPRDPAVLVGATSR
jgi:peptidoglycan lytic transglycosylase